MLGSDSCQVHHISLMPITSNGASIITSTKPTTNGSTRGLNFSLETHTISVYIIEGSVKEVEDNRIEESTAYKTMVCNTIYVLTFRMTNFSNKSAVKDFENTFENKAGIPLAIVC